MSIRSGNVLRSGFFVVGCAASLFVASALSAQATPPKAAEKHMDHGGAKEESHEQSAWKEMDAFHAVMEEAWHPAMKDSLGPARAAAPRLVVAAMVWAKSSAPVACQSAEIKAAVARLTPETQAVAKLVTSKGTDVALKAALKTVHDTYHIAEEGCKPHDNK